MRSGSDAGALRRWSAIPLRLVEGYGLVAHGCAKVMNGPTAIGPGAPADIDANDGLLGVIDFGELAAAGTPIAVGVADANGVTVLSGRFDGRR